MKLKLKFEETGFIIYTPQLYAHIIYRGLEFWMPLPHPRYPLQSGYYEFWSKTILVNKELPLVFQVIIIFHELGHFVLANLTKNPFSKTTANLNDIWHFLWNPVTYFTVRKYKKELEIADSKLRKMGYVLRKPI